MTTLTVPSTLHILVPKNCKIVPFKSYLLIRLTSYMVCEHVQLNSWTLTGRYLFITIVCVVEHRLFFIPNNSTNLKLNPGFTFQSCFSQQKKTWWAKKPKLDFLQNVFNLCMCFRNFQPTWQRGARLMPLWITFLAHTDFGLSFKLPVPFRKLANRR